MEALLVTETVALKDRAAFGVNIRVIVTLSPAKIAAGRVGELSEKYWLEIEALLTVIEAVPVFVAVTVSVLLVPAVTLPKSRLALFRDNVPDCDCVG